MDLPQNKVTLREETATEYILGWSLIVSLVTAGALLAMDNEWAGVVLVFVTVPLVLESLAT